MTCAQVFDRLLDYVDRELHDFEQVEEHMRDCARCLAEAEFERAVADEVRRKLQRVRVPPGMLQRIMQGVPP